MSKIKTAFFCSNCGYESAKWTGKCPSCEQWNTFVEEVITKDNKLEEVDWKKLSPDKKEGRTGGRTISLHEVVSAEEKRIITADPELNRVLGGGIVAGSIVLVAGEPGIGKSTLFLQNGLRLKNVRTLYISGEESEQQIKMRADRLNIRNEEFYLLTETSTQIIFQEIRKLRPQTGDRGLHPDPAISLHRVFCGECLADPGMHIGIPAFCQGRRHACLSDRAYHEGRQHCGTEDAGAYGGYGPAIRG
jgi:DNA repair protein RadA/Sms